MKVNVVSYSQPSPIHDKMTGMDVQDLVAYCARVSNPANQMNTESTVKLLNYLMKHKHWSPFEMVSVCLEIETTRDIARQLLRHRSFSFQEFSQRYADPTTDLDFSTREARFQDTKNRQNSIDIDEANAKHREINETFRMKQKALLRQVIDVYSWAIDQGIAKEQARAVLPEGLTNSRLYVNGTLRSWIHYIELRAAAGTQKEHIELAKACAQVISRVFPMLKMEE